MAGTKRSHRERLVNLKKARTALHPSQDAVDLEFPRNQPVEAPDSPTPSLRPVKMAEEESDAGSDEEQDDLIFVEDAADIII